MKLRSSILLVALFGLFLYNAANNSNYEEKESLILHGVNQVIDYAHFNPKTIDDKFSHFVFDKYLERIDGAKRFLTQDEVNQLEVFKNQIDDQVKSRKFDFFDKSVQLLNTSIDRAQKLFEETIELSHDFSIDESIEMDYEKRVYPKDLDQLEEFWRKLTKYEVMTKYLSLKEEQESETKEELEPDFENIDNEKEEKEILSEAELLEKAKEKVKSNFEDWFKSIGKLRREDRFQSYLASISNYFDPHTDYFSPKEKQDFDINMGGKLEGIGARLRTDGEYTKVVSIVPGGPAYKGKQLEENDIIRKVRQEDEEEALDISGMRIDDVVQKIRGKKGTTVFLTVKKESGELEEISIERDEVILDEGFARSAIVDFPGLMNNVGLIRLPKFYSSFEKKDGNSCAADVAKEIEKLKEENVNGIILDLRNNTGGSLQDVVKMSGLFIEKGPIVQVKSRGNKPYVHADKDKNVLYDGPLVVMVNNSSASASEILAAALQDYGRAIIVGSKSTFGKGTVQRFFDLDQALRGNEDMKPLGNVKITVQKFFRVDGSSTQLNGVTPDIVLPDGYHFIDRGEKEYDNALEWTEIEPVEYGQNVVRLDNIKLLQDASAQRISMSEDFQLVLENAERIKRNKDFSIYPINMNAFEKLMDEKDEEAKKFEGLFDKEIENLSIKNLTADLDYIQADSSRIDRNEDWLKRLKKDFYLHETLNIMRDMIANESSFATIEEKLDTRTN